MARPLRIEFPDALYHVTSRGNERRPIFRTTRDRETFLLLLGQTAKRYGWSVSAFVLMMNHYHLVIQTPEPNLSRGMHWLNGTYAGWFNRAHRRAGHLFQGRFHAFLIEKQAYFTEVIRYVVLNPVRAKIVTAPSAYRWSSYRATAGSAAAPDWLDTRAALEPFGENDEAARRNYEAFVFEKMRRTDSIWENAFNGIYLGTSGWAQRMRDRVESMVVSTDHPRTQRSVGRPAMATIVTAVSNAGGIAVDSLRRRGPNRYRAMAAWIGWHEGLVTLRTIAASLRLRSEGYVSRLIRRCERMLVSDPVLLRHLDAALIALR